MLLAAARALRPRRDGRLDRRAELARPLSTDFRGGDGLLLGGRVLDGLPHAQGRWRGRRVLRPSDSIHADREERALDRHGARRRRGRVSLSRALLA